jgi:hypothetical protein
VRQKHAVNPLASRFLCFKGDVTRVVKEPRVRQITTYGDFEEARIRIVKSFIKVAAENNIMILSLELLDGFD